MTAFLRLVDVPVERKANELRSAVALFRTGVKLERRLFERDPRLFSRIPESPFPYWASERVLSLFEIFPALQDGDRVARLGASTKNDGRFLRLAWEISSKISHAEVWVPFAKGGAYSQYYSDVFLLVRWRCDAEEIAAELLAKYPYLGSNVDFVLHRELNYGRPGLTWPARTLRGFGIRAMPAGCVFGHKGPAVLIAGDSQVRLLALLAITTSSTFCYLVELQMAFGSYEVGVVQRTPVPDLADEHVATLSLLGRRAWSLKRSLDTTNETSHAFLLPPGLNEKVTGVDLARVERDLADVQKQIDAHAFRLYGIDSIDRAVIEASSERTIVSDDSTKSADDKDDEGSEEAVNSAPSDLLFSWFVGVAFGRFDPRLVTPFVQSYKTSGGKSYTPLLGQRPIPAEPEPFEPLTPRSPGMWPEDEFPTVVPPDIMVDDAGHHHDIRLRVAEAAAAAGCHDSHDLRQWLTREFFPFHIRMYSKSRRKAPIYWQLATPSASYSVWLYIHAFSKDTLFRVHNDYLAPKLAHEERRLEEMARDVREKSTAAQRKVLSAQETFVGELRAFLDEVKRVAPLWNPNLDDGVIINFAPLWRLVPQHKSWQKELKSTWDALCDGKYDWAHLAMHLWPERVVPKCATDRSLAIAHGLQDVFWVEVKDGKWIAREKPTRSLEDLVRERTSPAVKAALKSLMEAPQTAGSGRKSKKG